MSEFLLDKTYWDKVLARLKPSSSSWIKQNKGSSSQKFIKPVIAIRVHEYNIKTNSIVNQFIKRPDELKGGLPPSRLSGDWQKSLLEAELEILKIAIEEGLLPSMTMHEGKVLVPIELSEDRTSPDPSTIDASQVSGFVYFARNGSLFKIGITENLLRRLHEIKPDEVLNVVRCKNFRELERDLHNRFKEARLPQTEYFRLSNSQVNEVNRLLTDLANF